MLTRGTSAGIELPIAGRTHKLGRHKTERPRQAVPDWPARLGRRRTRAAEGGCGPTMPRRARCEMRGPAGLNFNCRPMKLPPHLNHIWRRRRSCYTCRPGPRVTSGAGHDDRRWSSPAQTRHQTAGIRAHGQLQAKLNSFLAAAKNCTHFKWAASSRRAARAAAIRAIICARVGRRANPMRACTAAGRVATLTRARIGPLEGNWPAGQPPVLACDLVARHRRRPAA
jgi:hypothetical protein